VSSAVDHVGRVVRIVRFASVFATSNSLLQNDLAERGGFEPPVQVYPAQQISNLSCSATPAPLRDEGGAYVVPVGLTVP
jgi:hypothetical protein